MCGSGACVALFLIFIFPASEFLVVVQKTDAATRCNLQGAYWLQVGQEALLLRETQKKSLVREWPYEMLRRYGKDKVNNLRWSHTHTHVRCNLSYFRFAMLISVSKRWSLLLPAGVNHWGGAALWVWSWLVHLWDAAGWEDLLHDSSHHQTEELASKPGVSH